MNVVLVNIQYSISAVTYVSVELKFSLSFWGKRKKRQTKKEMWGQKTNNKAVCQRYNGFCLVPRLSRGFKHLQHPQRMS